MNILQEIDSTLHYENIEKAWHKYKYVFILVLIAIFAGTAAYNANKASVMAKSKNDTAIIFKTVLDNADQANYIEELNKALPSLQTTQGQETLKLEIAKAHKKAGNATEFEKAITELTTAKTQAVRHISIYMLAEHFLATDADKAIAFIDKTKLSKKDFTFGLVQEIKAMALTQKGNKEAAQLIYKNIIANEAFPKDLQNRAKFKLDQIK